jgi:hypothetical protein
MQRVCEKFFFPSQVEAETFRRELEERVIMAAVADGERDVTRLKAIALELLEA